MTINSRRNAKKIKKTKNIRKTKNARKTITKKQIRNTQYGGNIILLNTGIPQKY